MAKRYNSNIDVKDTYLIHAGLPTTIHETECNPLNLRDLGGIGFVVTSSFTYRYRAFRRCQMMAQAEGFLRLYV